MKIESSIDVNIVTLLSQVEPWLRSLLRDEVTKAFEQGCATSMSSRTPDLLDSKRVAEYLGISEVTLWRLRKEGRIGFFRIGSRVNFLS